jgi:DNA-binding protein H-NS
MAKLTVAGIRQQIASLEAKAVRLTEVETKASVAKVRAMMESLGVTLEHLTAAVSKKVRSAKKAVSSGKAAASRKVTAAKKSASAKRAGAGVARYRDPATGATWSGFGRAPAWLASAPDREVFAVGQGSAAKPKKVAASKKSSRATSKSAAPSMRKAGAVTRAAKKVKVAAVASKPNKDVPRKAAKAKAIAAAHAGDANAPEVSAGN